MRKLLLNPIYLRQIRKYTTEDFQRWYEPLYAQETDIRIYNSAARRPVRFLLNDNFVSWYTCGPTVYDAAHLGHASCYVKLDIIQRILKEHFSLNLVTAMNITDIDDKIIAKSIETGRNWQELAKSNEKQFWTDMRKLNVIEPNLKIRVTEQMPAIIAFIETLYSKGYAYEGKDKSVYFNVSKFRRYGKLQNVNIEELSADAAGQVENNKRAAEDFTLWKARKIDSEPSWPSPWGPGRPGWHIECSALATMVFGRNIDVHAGGLDLRFPHHENEEAQSSVYHDTNQWVNYWLHTGQLSVKGQKDKMSKSLKNTISIDDMLSKYTADEFRMACVLSNYRNSMEYSDELMEMSRNTLNRFKTFRSDCQAYFTGKKPGSHLDANLALRNLKYARTQVDACFKNDFDTGHSVSVLLDQVASISRCINAKPETELTAATCLDAIAAVDNFVEHILRSFGFSFVESDCTQIRGAENEIDLNELLEDLLRSRKTIRDRGIANKNRDILEICDELRDCLQQHGIEIKDHPKGSSWSFSGTIKK